MKTPSPARSVSRASCSSLARTCSTEREQRRSPWRLPKLGVHSRSAVTWNTNSNVGYDAPGNARSIRASTGALAGRVPKQRPRALPSRFAERACNRGVSGAQQQRRLKCQGHALDEEARARLERIRAIEVGTQSSDLRIE